MVTTTVAPSVNAICKIALADINTSTNVRRAVVPADHGAGCVDEPCALCGLAASIAELGLLQPIAVRPAKRGKFDVVFGHRRLAAIGTLTPEQLDKAGLGDGVECIVRADTGGRAGELEKLLAQIVENDQRLRMHPIEEAHALQRLRDEHGMNQLEIKAATGRSQGHVSKRLALVDKLPARYQAQLDAGAMTIADAEALSRLPDVKAMDEAMALHKNEWQYEDSIVEAVKEVERRLAACRRCDESRETLASAGVKEIDYPRYGSWYGAKSAPLGKGYGKVDVTVARHAKERCHAAAINPDDGQIVYVCTSPATHNKKPTPAATDADRAERKRRAEAAAKAKEYKTAGQARATFMRGLLARRQRKCDELTRLLVLQHVGIYSDLHERACNLLNLPAGAGNSYRRFGDQLAAYAAKSDDNVTRVALALAFAAAEKRIDETSPTGAFVNGRAWDEVAVRHLDYLEKAGYVLAGVERAERDKRRGKTNGKSRRQVATAAAS